MRFFSKNYFKEYFRNQNIFWKFNETIKNYELQFSKRFIFLNPALYIIFKLPKWAKVLDVWCWIWNWLRLIHKYRPDLELYWADIGDVEEFLPDYVTFKKSSWDKLPFEDNYFDYITNMHVLEHVLNPQDFVNEFYRVLKTEWYCYIEAPYISRIFFPDEWNFYNDPTHIKPFVVSWLKRLLIIWNLKVITAWKIRWSYIMWIVLLIFSPIITIKYMLWFDKWWFFQLLWSIFWSSCYIIWKKTKE